MFDFSKILDDLIPAALLKINFIIDSSSDFPGLLEELSS